MTGYNRAWFNIIRVHRRLYPRITKILKSEGIRDPIWYEILLKLENAGSEGVLMSSLEAELYLPQYALSRHVTRLEAEEYLNRQFISDGRRKQVLVLTSKGKGVHERIWPKYVEAIQMELSSHISIEDAYQLAYTLTNLLRSED